MGGLWNIRGRRQGRLFLGDVDVGGALDVGGNISKGGGSFKIDHPLDPENKYLYHSFVESPDMKNIYDGVVTLDASGSASVSMPDWFDAINEDFRYQLTAIGAPAPSLYIAEKLENGRFKISGGPAGIEVSWMLTGIRKNPYAEAYRIPVEEDKIGAERGTYLYPEVYGQPQSKSVIYTEENNKPLRELQLAKEARERGIWPSSGPLYGPLAPSTVEGR